LISRQNKALFVDKKQRESVFGQINVLNKFNEFYSYFLERYEPEIPVYHINALEPLGDVWKQIFEIFGKEQFGRGRDRRISSRVDPLEHVKYPPLSPPLI
jgi:hypothetical protein